LTLSKPPNHLHYEILLTRLLNDLAQHSKKLILVLDDYHTINSSSVDKMLVFLIDNLPLKLHVVLVSREDPGLPLARYRARGQMTELRTKDLKFSYAEVRDFFRVMEITLTESGIAALEVRTEGWAAGLQFAALALQGNREKHAQAEFIASFTGSHRFVLDYLVEEVLLQSAPKPFRNSFWPPPASDAFAERCATRFWIRLLALAAKPWKFSIEPIFFWFLSTENGAGTVTTISLPNFFSSASPPLRFRPVPTRRSSTRGQACGLKRTISSWKPSAMQRLRETWRVRKLSSKIVVCQPIPGAQ